MKSETSRYHVRAWGSDKEPDIDAELSFVPKMLSDHYPNVVIRRLTPISIQAVKKYLDRK